MSRLKEIIFPSMSLLYLKRLRKVEQLLSKEKLNAIQKLYLRYKMYRFRKLGLKLSYEIYPFCFGEGLCLYHHGIIVNSNTRAGKNCTLRAYTVIGSKYSDGGNDAPTIGDNVDIGCNCTIIGPIKIGDNVTIGAGSVVITDLPSNTVCAGNPAKVIRHK